ncbi:MAG: SIMPL domain-containing protein [Acidobacteriales bacterium]|nr:SIMPL domain-containing protein [Terriglobales bacterium]
MKYARWMLAVMALGAVGAWAQDDGQKRVLLNTVSVGADGKYESDPDTAVVSFTIASQKDSSDEAYAQASKAAERIRQALRSSGLDPKAATMGFYSLQPMYDWKSPKRKVIGYRVTANVTLKITDFTKIGKLLTDLATIEDTEGQNLSYILENLDTAKQRAIEDAYNRAKTSAQTVAIAGGRGLGELVYASVDTFEQPPPVPIMMKSMAMADRAEAPAPTQEFTPQKITVTAHVNAIFGMK